MFYRGQVTDALLRQLDKIGLPEPDRGERLREFWEAVQAEMIRLTYCGHGTGGGAA